MNLRSPALAAALLMFGLSSCENTMDKIFEPQPLNMAADPVAVVPPEFLHTRYGPLNQWLDQAIRVQILDLPLMSVFEHPALRGLHYHFVKPPQDNPIVTIDKLAMTRRQLLWVLSHDHQLHMTPAFGPRGEVTHIDIRSRSVDLPESGIITTTVTTVRDK